MEKNLNTCTPLWLNYLVIRYIIRFHNEWKNGKCFYNETLPWPLQIDYIGISGLNARILILKLT